MATMQEIQKRIDSIGVTRQISQAMQLVSNTKIRRARELMASSRPFFAENLAMLQTVAAGTPPAGRYYEPAPAGAALYIVVGADRGLCGPYNVNVNKYAYRLMQDEPGEVLLFALGAKVREYFARRRVRVEKAFRGISQNPFYRDGRQVGDEALALYGEGRVDKLVLVYTAFESMLAHTPTHLTLLPLAAGAHTAPKEEDAGTNGPAAPKPLLRLEPDEDELLNAVVPGYLYACIFGALAEGAVCEQSARVTSMDAAVKSCGDLMDELQLEYNQARQGAITQELNEIVSGAEAIQ